MIVSVEASFITCGMPNLLPNELCQHVEGTSLTYVRKAKLSNLMTTFYVLEANKDLCSV